MGHSSIVKKAIPFLFVMYFWTELVASVALFFVFSLPFVPFCHLLAVPLHFRALVTFDVMVAMADHFEDSFPSSNQP